MKNLNLNTIAERLAVILTGWHLADASQFEEYRGRMAEIRDILKQAEITEGELIGALADADFAMKLTQRLLGGNRAGRIEPDDFNG